MRAPRAPRPSSVRRALGATGRAALILLLLAVEVRADDAAEAASLHRQAQALVAGGRAAEALPLWERAIALREKAFGPEDPGVAELLNDAASAEAARGEWAAAQAKYERCRRILQAARGPDEPLLAFPLLGLAQVLLTQGDLDAAGAALGEGLRLRERAGDAGDPALVGLLYALADAQRKAGRIDAALDAVERARGLQERRLGADHPDIALTWGNLAFLAEARGDLAGARRALQRGVEILEGARGSGMPSAEGLLLRMAELAERQGDLSAATAALERALVGTAPPSLALLARLASLYERIPDPAAVVRTCERAEEVVKEREGEGSTLRAEVLLVLGRAEVARGESGRAVEVLAQALAIREAKLGVESVAVAEVLCLLAAARADQAAYGEAEALLHRAAGILGASSEPSATAHRVTALLVEGRVRRATGARSEARQAYEEALALLEGDPRSSPGAQGVVLGNLSVLLREQGMLEEARLLVARAVRLLEGAADADRLAVARGWMRLGDLCLDAADPTEAEAAFQRALGIRERVLGPDHPAVAASRNSLAVAAAHRGRHAEAAALYERSLAATEAHFGSDHVETAQTMLNLGVTLRNLGQRDRARPLLQRGLAVLEAVHGETSPRTATARKSLALLEAAEGNAEDARRLWRGAIAAWRRVLFAGSRAAEGMERIGLSRRARETLDAWLVEAPGVGETGYEEVLALRGFATRAEAAERAALRGADGALRERWAALAAAERTWARLAGSMPRRSEAGRRVAWRAEFGRASAERERLALELARDAAPLHTAGEDGEAGLVAVRAALGSGEALVDTLRSGGRYLAWVVRREGPATRVDLGPAGEIESDVEAFVGATRHGGPTEEAWASAATALRERLVAPLEARLGEGVTSLVISPDAALATVPFAALPGRRAGTFLADEYRIAYVSMAQDLVPRADGGRSGKGAILVGGVDYDEAAAGDDEAAATAPARSSSRAPGGIRFRPLPDTAREVEAIQATFGEGVTLLRGQDATEARLRARVRGKRVLHLATHGFVRADLPSALGPSREDADRWLGAGLETQLVGWDPRLLAGLALAGANPRAGGAGDDGILTALEASHLDLSGVALVTLSACETALGRAESGEGVLGLVQAFRIAGARDVVASLWPVDDEATGLLMGRMYALMGRAEDPLSPSDAMGEASRWLRTVAGKGGRRFDAPRYWAAFVCYGRR